MCIGIPGLPEILVEVFQVSRDMCRRLLRILELPEICVEGFLIYV